MGGIAFKDDEGNSLASEVERQYVVPTLEDLFQNHLEPAGVTAYEPVGSTGKKSLAGDLDIAVHFNGGDPKQVKQLLFRNLASTLDPDTIKVIGPNLTILYPIKDDPQSRLAQVDLMIASDLAGTSWLMSGTGDEGIKGVFRNSMLSHIAAQRSKEMGSHEKITVATPGGLGKLQLDPSLDPSLPKNKRKFKLVGSRTTNPQEILKGLGINASPAEIATFDGLVDVMVRDPELKSMLVTFSDYLSQRAGTLQHPQLQRVLSYVEKSMSENVIRKTIRLIMEKEMKKSQINEKIIQVGDEELYDLTDDNLEALRTFIRSKLKIKQYDPDESRQGYINAIDAVRGDAQFSDAMGKYPEPYKKLVLDYLMKIEDGPEVIAPMLFSLSAGNPASVDIKAQLLDILHYNEGQGLGRGELLTPLLYDKSSWVGGASATHDVDIGEQAWEIKHHRSFNEPFVFGGGAKSFFRSPNALAKAISDTGYDVSQLQTMGRDESLKAIKDIVDNYKPVLEGQPIDSVGKMLYLLDAVAREHVLPRGEAGVLLYQSKSAAGSPTKTRFVDKDDLRFYAFGGRKTGRYLLYAPDKIEPPREAAIGAVLFDEEAEEEKSEPEASEAPAQPEESQEVEVEEEAEEENLNESSQNRWQLLAGIKNV